MSKRQIRITDADRVREHIPAYINKKISLVMQDNTVLFGILRRAENGTLILENMRRKKIKIPAEKVLEFFADIDA